MARQAYRRLAVRMFGAVSAGSEKSFKSLAPQLKGAGIHMLLKSYVALIFFTTFLAYLISLAAVLAFSLLFVEDLVMVIYYVSMVPVLCASVAFMAMYVYPGQRYRRVRRSIENNLPFALIHLDSVASSGIPPDAMFELIGKLREYGEISGQCRLVVRNIKTFGMSSVSAINDVAERTPSPAFKQVLTGISSTTAKGGNLSSYLSEMADKALFDYRLRREQYVKTLSTYADIYTAVLIAAPLLIMTVLVMMNLIGGDVFGMTIPGAISLMSYFVMPLVNIAFLAFVHMSHPGN